MSESITNSATQIASVAPNGGLSPKSAKKARRIIAEERFRRNRASEQELQNQECATQVAAVTPIAAPSSKSAKKGKRVAKDELQNQTCATQPQVAPVAPVAVPSLKSAKKGKRAAEDELQNQARAKKRTNIVERNVIKKEDEISTSEDFSSDEETETRSVIHPPEKPAATSRNGSVEVSKKRTESSESSDSEDSNYDKEDKTSMKVASKINQIPAVVAATKNTTAAVFKKEDKPCNDSDSNSSLREDDLRTGVQKNSTLVASKLNQTPVAAAKKGSAVVPQKKDVSSDSFDLGSSSNEDDKNSTLVASKINQTLIAAPASTENGSGVPQKKDESSDSFYSDSSSDEDDKKSTLVASEINQTLDAAPASTENGSGVVPQKRDESSDSFYSDSSSDEDDKKSTLVASKINQTLVAAPASTENGSGAVPQKKDESSDGFYSDSSSDEDDKNSTQVASKINQTLVAAPAATKNGSGVAPQKKDESSDSFYSDSSSDEDDKNSTHVTSKIYQTPVASMNGSAVVSQKKDKSSDSFDSDSSSDENDETSGKIASQAKKDPLPSPKNDPVVASKKVDLSDSSSEDESEEHKPKTPSTPQVQTTGAKTLSVGNLSYSIEQEDLETFFKDAGEITEVRLATNKDGSFKGFAHVDFATAAAAQKALEMNGKDLLGRDVQLCMAHKLNSYTPHTEERNQNQMEGNGQGKVIFVEGFNKFVGMYQIESQLNEHFGSCGEISRMSIPRYYGSDASRGNAHIEFIDGASFAKALQLNGSKLGDCVLTVTEARPRDDSKGQGKVILVEGFNKFGGMVQIESILNERFGSCGEISRMSIPRDYITGAPRGHAHIGFIDGGSLAKALQLNGSKLGDCVLTVKEAKPRGDIRGSDRNGQRGHGGGRSGGRGRFLGGGRFLGR